MDIVIMVGQLLLSLSLLIVLHELGHFLPAKWFKIRVEKFYLFFDSLFPFSIGNFSIFKIKRGDTEYGLGWFPLGGYVKISGMIDESMDTESMKEEPKDWEFRSKPAWQRLIVMLGGVTVNFVLGIFIFSMLLFSYGEEFIPLKNADKGIYVDSLGMQLGLQNGDLVTAVGTKTLDRLDDRAVAKEIIFGEAKTLKVKRAGQEIELPVPANMIEILTKNENAKKSLFTPPFPFVVQEVDPKMPAAKANLKKGDKVIALNGKPTAYYQDFVLGMTGLKSKPITMDVIRGVDTMQLAMTTNDNGKVGVAPVSMTEYYKTETQSYGLLGAFSKGYSNSINFLGGQIKAFGMMFRGEIKATESMGGFGSFGKMFGSDWDWHRFWTNTALISLILAFMNLLPIPGLDGGYVLFLFYEILTGRKPSDKFMEWTTTIGLLLILGLVIFANGMDIMRGCN